MDSNTATFCFAHLSDPHLSSLREVHWQQLMNKRLLGYLSWRRRRRAEHRIEVLDALVQDLQKTHPAHIAITGDLTHIGLPDEFVQARRWLDALGDPENITVVPGNHDAYVATPWQQSFIHWQPYMCSDEAGAAATSRDSGEPFPSLRVRDGVAFIGLSSARPSAPFLATGSIGEPQLESFAELLQHCAQQGLFRVVLLHHPPVPGEEKWRKRLTDAARLCRVISQQGAELVLHGHSHRSVQSAIEIPGTHIPVFGIPSASAIGLKPGRSAQYYVYRVQESGKAWELGISVRAYHAEKEAFVSGREQQLRIDRRCVGAPVPHPRGIKV